MSALEIPSPISPSSALGRFRLVDRQPRPNVRRVRRRVTNPFRMAVFFTALPALVLVSYVALWTAAVHGGYQEQHLNQEIQRVRIENQSLLAEVRRLQSPTRIYHRAAELGMQECQQREFIAMSAANLR